MKKLFKNKFLVLVISVALVTCAYLGIEKLIDEYMFNGDFVDDDLLEGEDDGVTLDEEETSETGKGAGMISNDEVDLVLEGDGGELNGDVLEDVSGDDSGEGVEDSEKDGDGPGEETDKIYVYITGEVNVPGVVILNEGSRIVDAINAAGGTTAKANVSKVNLVYVLEDGMKVNIPNSSDLKSNPNFEYITMSSGDGANDGSLGGGSSSGTVGSASGFSGGGFSGSGYSVVNINSATQTELESLPGIGPSLALKIIDYRKENGKFSSIEDIKNVSGIGDSKFESLKRYITV